MFHDLFLYYILWRLQTCLPSHNAISIFEMTCQYFGVLVSIKVLLKEKGKEIIK